MSFLPLQPFPAGASPEGRLGLTGLALLPVPLWTALALAPSGMIPALAVYLAGLALAMVGMAAAYPHARMGACNLVTTIRLALVAAILALGMEVAIAGPVPGWAIFGMAVTALLLDGVDGYLARRARLTSDFGARYDMEVDAALAATLALVLLALGRGGSELLVLGFSRYVFVLASRWAPWLSAPLPERWTRKAICVVQIATLAVLTAPLLPEALARPLALSAAGLLIWSFARDIRWLAARR
ncbi:MAG: CDP-alcohol phosphatidyltransferase family protein [Pseudomonadota bacterium]